MTGWQWGWLAWILAGLGYEVYALATNWHRTLSATIWQFEGTGWTAARYFVLAVLIWFLLHFVWGMLR